jgi:hypothetical protein
VGRCLGAAFQPRRWRGHSERGFQAGQPLTFTPPYHLVSVPERLSVGGPEDLARVRMEPHFQPFFYSIPIQQLSCLIPEPQEISLPTTQNRPIALAIHMPGDVIWHTASASRR